MGLNCQPSTWSREVPFSFARIVYSGIRLWPRMLGSSISSGRVIVRSSIALGRARGPDDYEPGDYKP